MSNKVSTGHFVSLPAVGPSFQVPDSLTKKIKDILSDVLYFLVGEAGLEPARPQ